MTAFRHDDWSELVGAFVQVRLGRRCLKSGLVDAAMPDSSALWLAAEQIETRSLVTKAEGYEVWVELNQLENLREYRRMTSLAIQPKAP